MAATRSRRSRFVSALLGLCMLAGLAATVAGFLGPWWWIFDLASHFRAHFAAGLLALAAFAAVLRRRRWAAAALLGSIINGLLVAWLYVPVEREPASSLGELRLLHLNVHTNNTRHDLVAAEILASDADFVFLQEMDARWVAGLRDRVASEYAFVTRKTRSDNFGIALLARQDLRDGLRLASIRYLDPTEASSTLPVLEVVVNVERRPVALLSTHPLPPMSAEHTAARNSQLHACGQWAAKQNRPSAILGDFNTTPFSHAFDLLTEPADLINSQRGFGLDGTWPSARGVLLMIPIDHCVHSPDLVTLDRRVGPDVGSDHRPLHITLGVPASGPPS